MKILLAVDLSEPDAVTNQAVDIARRLDADLYVLHVHVPTPAGSLPMDPMTGFGDMAYAVFDPEMQATVEETERHLFEDFVRQRFTYPVRPALLQGDPAQVILDETESLAVDLVVVAKRRHGALERFLLGSVSQTVVNHSRRPVLVVPIPD